MGQSVPHFTSLEFYCFLVCRWIALFKGKGNRQ